MRSDDSRASSTCQNPELASSLENILPPLPICAKVCSTDGAYDAPDTACESEAVKQQQATVCTLQQETMMEPVKQASSVVRGVMCLVSYYTHTRACT